MTRTEIRWVLLPFEILLGFVLAGIAAVLVAGQLYVWYEPVGGFFAAIAVVAVAYIRAPAWPVMAALVVHSMHFRCLKNISYPPGYANIGMNKKSGGTRDQDVPASRVGM